MTKTLGMILIKGLTAVGDKQQLGQQSAMSLWTAKNTSGTRPLVDNKLSPLQSEREEENSDFAFKSVNR